MSSEPIDLRSDTVTRPTAEMRKAMAEARVGDDVYGEDPTVHELERETAELLGKEAALFMPSGTMSNQVALLVHTSPGDQALVTQGAHMLVYESGAAAAVAGVQLTPLGEGGRLAPDAIDAAVLGPGDHHPKTRLLAIENTHNRSGGRVFPQPLALEVIERARAHGLGLHLDGARLWNAAIATGSSVSELAAPFDTVSVCFSKGLGAPVGSALCGRREAIREARRFRKRLGGGMRQAGVVAAAALHALRHHRGLLARDHDHARLLAELLVHHRGVRLEPDPVETNIVMLHVSKDALALVARVRQRGVLISAVDGATLRLVTHLDLDEAAVRRAAEVLGGELERSGEP